MIQAPSLRAVALLNTADRKEIDLKQSVIRDFAARLGIEIVSFIAVDGADAGINQVVSVAADKKAAAIIFDSALTLSVVPHALLSIIERCMSFGIELVFAETEARFDKKQLATLKALVLTTLEASVRARSLKIKKGLKTKQRKTTRRFGGVTEENEFVAMILQLYKQGMSLQKICEVLEMSDVRTVQKKKWHPTTVKRIIDRAKKPPKS